MRHMQGISIILFALLFSGAANAKFDGNPILLVINGTCVLQDVGYRNSRFGQMIQQRPDFPGWEGVEKSPMGKCTRDKKFISDSLCKASLDVDIEDEGATNQWASANADEISKIRPFIEFALSRKLNKGECP